MIQYNKERPLRVFTAFSGYDSQCLALDRLRETFPEFEYELVGWSEIDKYAIQAHNALYPQWADRNYGDISKIDWNQVPDFDLFTYSSPCFIAGTLIHTEDGFKPIEDVKVGDKVLTHTNRYCNVEKTGSKPSDDIYILKGSMFDTITCTGNHPFYARKMSRKGHNNERTFDKPGWIEAKDLNKNTYLGYAINTKNELPIWNGSIDNRYGHNRQVNKLQPLLDNPYFWYLMGRYVGDGWKYTNEKYGSGIIICCSGRNHESLVNALQALDIHFYQRKEPTVIKLYISMNEMNQFVSRYGYYSHGKKIDAETINLPINLLEGFINGIIDSDGCYTNNEHKVTTVSRELAYGLQQCIAKAFHRPVKMYKTIRNPTCIIEGRMVNQRDTYTIVWHTDGRKQDHAFYDDGYIWFPLKSVKKIDCNAIVYNLQVAEDHSYTANGTIVHNCQDFSVAGLQKGGDEGSGTRSSLLWECRKAIEIKRPRFALLENVKALVSKRFYPLFMDWVSTLVSLGYYNWWQVLNSTDYENPQNRERVFLVSCLDNIQYQFPEPMELPYCVADILDYDSINQYRINRQTEREFIESLDMERLEKEARFADERGLTVDESEIDDEDV